MRCAAFLLSLMLVFAVSAAEVESRVLTHYLPQDFLETAVRTEKWSEVPLAVKGGVRKGDVVRIWAGGLIDRGNSEKPGLNVNGPEGMPGGTGPEDHFTLTSDAGTAYALLFKTETSGVKKCFTAGKPLEIKLANDRERLWVGFNDERGHYLDNHLGKGRRHEFDPLWVRIEVVRIVVD
ncbi:MAG TPA: hypothetical protein VMG10_19260 [Gemmataceae bacterium]|nr:hypothetical protein [Gemmataceae bacterium]